MDIQSLGAWGEFLGGISGILAAIGVISTLLYLARQIQQNTKSVQSTNYGNHINSIAAIHQTHMEAVEILPEYLLGKAQEWDYESVDYLKFHGHATLGGHKLPLKHHPAKELPQSRTVAGTRRSRSRCCKGSRY